MKRFALLLLCLSLFLGGGVQAQQGVTQTHAGTLGLVNALGNTRIGGPDNLTVSIWFTPKKTGVYDLFKTFFITAEQQKAQGKTGYASGDNGLIQVSMNGAVLGTFKPQVWPQWKFPFAIEFQAGVRYQLDFKNVAADPINNYCSIDALQRIGTLAPPTMGLSYTYQGKVTDRNYQPIFSLENSSGADPTFYISSGWIEVGLSDLKPGRLWRQHFADGTSIVVACTAEYPPVRKGLTGAAADGTTNTMPNPTPGQWTEYSDDGGVTWLQFAGKQYDLQYGA
jgi:hypothetical protein